MTSRVTPTRSRLLFRVRRRRRALLLLLLFLLLLLLPLLLVLLVLFDLGSCAWSTQPYGNQLDEVPTWAWARIAAMAPHGPVANMLASHSVALKVRWPESYIWLGLSGRGGRDADADRRRVEFLALRLKRFPA